MLEKLRLREKLLRKILYARKSALRVWLMRLSSMITINFILDKKDLKQTQGNNVCKRRDNVIPTQICLSS